MLATAIQTLDRKQPALSQLARTLWGVFPLTLQGVITLLITGYALRSFGYGSMDLVVFALTICALAILLFTLFCVVSCGIIVQRRVQKEIAAKEARSEHSQVEVDFPNETGFHLQPLTYFPLIKLDWQIVWPDYLETRIRHQADGYLEEEVIPHRRCRADTLIRQFTVSDVLGFCRYSWRQQQQAPLMALPRINTIRNLPLLRSMTAEDGIPNPSGDPEGDRMEIRPYVAGDSVRNIMWKTYARSRQLNVRLPEKSVFHSQQTIAYLLSSPHDEAAAAVARMALETGALGEHWCFGADGSEVPADNLSDALIAVAASRALPGSHHDYGLDRFLSHPTVPTMAHCIVFAAAERGDWLAPLKATVATGRGRFSLVLATDGIRPQQSATLWTKIQRNLLIRKKNDAQHYDGESDSQQSLAALIHEIMQESGQLFDHVLIIDRKTGLCFDQRLRKI